MFELMDILTNTWMNKKESISISKHVLEVSLIKLKHYGYMA